MSGILNALYCADRAMELADQYGIGMVGIRNTPTGCGALEGIGLFVHAGYPGGSAHGRHRSSRHGPEGIRHLRDDVREEIQSL
ncbi:hypothetical protein [Enterocloster clostridioformis]|uniref:hypothetical protein n=1 Tax=Enterocloster clostridioformis TaxID=1531 RepID=UPI000417E8AD|nr:hypothetical protein [Enterocloster clostridioformis]